MKLLGCKYVSARLSAYVDGELSGNEMLSVQRHVQRCSACAKEIEEMRAAKRQLGAFPDVPIPAGLEDRLVESVFRAQVRQRRRSIIAFGSAVVALCGAFAVVAIVRANQEQAMAERQRMNDRAFEVARDQAYMERYDSLDGGSSVIAASYPHAKASR